MNPLDISYFVRSKTTARDKFIMAKDGHKMRRIAKKSLSVKEEEQENTNSEKRKKQKLHNLFDLETQNQAKTKKIRP